MGIFLKDINLKGKTALVTGATKGLGRGAAQAIAEAGGDIIAIGRNQSELNSLAKVIKKLKVKYTSFNCDVNDYNKIKEFITTEYDGDEMHEDLVKHLAYLDKTYKMDWHDISKK